MSLTALINVYAIQCIAPAVMWGVTPSQPSVRLIWCGNSLCLYPATWAAVPIEQWQLAHSGYFELMLNGHVLGKAPIAVSPLQLGSAPMATVEFRAPWSGVCGQLMYSIRCQAAPSIEPVRGPVSYPVTTPPFYTPPPPPPFYPSFIPYTPTASHSPSMYPPQPYQPSQSYSHTMPATPSETINRSIEYNDYFRHLLPVPQIHSHARSSANDSLSHPLWSSLPLSAHSAQPSATIRSAGDDSPRPCVTDCGFFGSRSTGNLCSQCCRPTPRAVTPSPLSPVAALLEWMINENKEDDANDESADEAELADEREAADDVEVEAEEEEEDEDEDDEDEVEDERKEAVFGGDDHILARDRSYLMSRLLHHHFLAWPSPLPHPSLDAQQLKALPLFAWTRAAGQASELCSVCQSEYTSGEQVRCLPCFHMFHEECIDPWSVYRDTHSRSGTTHKR